jgi:TLC domain
MEGWRGPILRWTGALPIPFSLINDFPESQKDEREGQEQSGTGDARRPREIARDAAGAFAIGWAGSLLAHVAGGLLVRVAVKRRKRDTLDVLYLAEVAPSTLHGLVAGLAGLYFQLAARVWKDDVFVPQPRMVDRMLALSAGYSLHDMLVMFRHGDSVDMWLHHVLMIWGCLTMVCYRLGSFFPSVFFVSELTVLPQNLLYVCTQLMGKERFEKTGLFTALLYARVAFHVAFRVGLTPFCFAYARYTGVTYERWRQTPGFLQAALLWQLTAFQLMNLFWFKGAVVRVLRHRRRRPLVA